MVFPSDIYGIEIGKNCKTIMRFLQNRAIFSRKVAAGLRPTSRIRKISVCNEEFSVQLIWVNLLEPQIHRKENEEIACFYGLS